MVNKKLSADRILIAKTTHLGDLVISLPMAAVLKRHYPHSTVIFLTHTRTADVAKRCLDIDEVYPMPDAIGQLPDLLRQLNIDVFIQTNTSKELGIAAKAADIPVRIGSWYRHYNWWLCSHRVAISRPHRQLNKRVLDLQHLEPLGITAREVPLTPELYRWSRKDPAALAQTVGLNDGKRRIILHPTLITSRAHQWPLSAYQALIDSLPTGRYQWIITGTAGDRAYLEPLLSRSDGGADIVDTVGRLSLDELMTLMTACDGLVAGSTGPLHLAAALGLHSLGLYQSAPDVHKRWAPLGRFAEMLYSPTRCCGEKKRPVCPCILAIEPDEVKQKILAWFGDA